jgi:hypothetical protein
MKSVLKMIGVTSGFTTAYHPQTDGQTERFNKTLIDMLSMYVNSRQTDWDLYLPYVLFAYRTAKHASTGIEPFYLVYGRNATFPTDVAFEEVHNPPKQDEHVEMLRKRIATARDIAKTAIERAQWNQRLSYDPKRNKVVEYKPGDLVWVFKPSTEKKKATKLLHRWKGPYTVIKKLGEVNYELWNSAKPKKNKVVHVRMIKKCLDPAVRFNDQIPNNYRKIPQEEEEVNSDMEFIEMNLDQQEMEGHEGELTEEEEKKETFEDNSDQPIENNWEHESPTDVEELLPEPAAKSKVTHKKKAAAKRWTKAPKEKAPLMTNEEVKKLTDWEHLLERVAGRQGKGKEREYFFTFMAKTKLLPEWIPFSILKGKGKIMVEEFEKNRRLMLPPDEF